MRYSEHLTPHTNTLLVVPAGSQRSHQTLTMAYGHYKKHDKIVIVGGSYKGKEGVFIGLTGLQSARVKIDGDTVQERTIRLTSFKLAARPSNIEISLEDYETMKEEIAMLLLMVQRLQLKVESLNV